MNENGDYDKPGTRADEGEKVNSQMIFGDEAAKSAKIMSPQNTRTFIPEMKV